LEEEVAGSQQRALSGLRIFTASSLLAVGLICIALAVREMPQGFFAGVVSFAAGLLVTPLAASPFEWLVHRHIYHRRGPSLLSRIHAIHQAHHFAYFPTWRYVTGGPPRRLKILGGRTSTSTSTWTNALTRSAHFSFYMVLGLVLICAPAWLLSQSIPFLAGTVSALVIISDLFIRVHDAIHRPAAHSLLQRQRWFRFLDDHHFIHHVDTEANVNFLLPLADFMYGTLRRSLTNLEVEQHGTRSAAKAEPSGLGEPAAQASSSKSAAVAAPAA